MELNLELKPDEPDVPACVPGSVQGALREAGVIPNWEMGLASRACEWVENREWVYRVSLPDPWCMGHGLKRLRCKGLDGVGRISCNKQVVGRFDNTFIPYVFDLTPAIKSSDNQLEIVFEACLPRWLGQFGYASKMPPTKPRFNYTWDWQPRVVQIGIWDDIHFEIIDTTTIDRFRCHTSFNTVDGLGALHWHANILGDRTGMLRITITDAQGNTVHTSLNFITEELSTIHSLPVEPWWPNGMGGQNLYRVACEAIDDDGEVSDTVERRVGFREVSWHACTNAPKDADPWICKVNGKPVFIRGVNWTPVRANFADVSDEMTYDRVQSYQRLNMNMLRVWGGSTLEKEAFYLACDELGMMVWQEFPLSSAGIDNSPPYDNASLTTLIQIAESYIESRQHHASLVMWCGGNELQTADCTREKEGSGHPWDASHPVLTQLQEIVVRKDPDRRFVPTSPTGPRFIAEAKEFGQGLHWDVHGPWTPPGDTKELSQAYWDADDSLFRSEIGCPAAANADLIRKYAGECPAYPATYDNPLFRRFAWWIDVPFFIDEMQREPNNLEEYVRWSQNRQATYLAMAANQCINRFPDCGGILFWMGHDAFPCPSNTAIIDFEGNPKPAALALKEAFQALDR